jgi:thiol:disulfide interchange protein DsbD
MTGLEVEWVHSFERATENAEAENKPIMVDFYAENCPACIEMDRFTYSNTEVVKESRGFIAAKLYANDNKDIVRKYGILGYPAAVFLKPDGTQIGETAYGFIEADRFLKLMDEARRHY